MKRTTISFKKFIESVSKDTFTDYYFNHSRKDTQKYFNIGNTVFDRYIKYYMIKKSKDLIYEVRKKTNLEKYGYENPFQDVEKIKQSYIKKNGSLENHYRKGIEKIRAKCKQLGITWSNQTLEAKEKLKKN